jgi:hypothetical protein
VCSHSLSLTAFTTGARLRRPGVLRPGRDARRNLPAPGRALLPGAPVRAQRVQGWSQLLRVYTLMCPARAPQQHALALTPAHLTLPKREAAPARPRTPATRLRRDGAHGAPARAQVRLAALLLHVLLRGRPQVLRRGRRRRAVPPLGLPRRADAGRCAARLWPGHAPGPPARLLARLAARHGRRASAVTHWRSSYPAGRLHSKPCMHRACLPALVDGACAQSACWTAQALCMQKNVLCGDFTTARRRAVRGVCLLDSSSTMHAGKHAVRQ